MITLEKVQVRLYRANGQQGSKSSDGSHGTN